MEVFSYILASISLIYLFNELYLKSKKRNRYLYVKSNYNSFIVDFKKIDHFVIDKERGAIFFYGKSNLSIDIDCMDELEKEIVFKFKGTRVVF